MELKAWNKRGGKMRIKVREVNYNLSLGMPKYEATRLYENGTMPKYEAKCEKRS